MRLLLLSPNTLVLSSSLSALQQNRPYTALVVYENLHQSIKKPALIKIMDELSEEGVLQLKDFKKVRVYLAKQVRPTLTATRG